MITYYFTFFALSFLIFSTPSIVYGQNAQSGDPLKWFKKADSLYSLEEIDEEAENHALELFLAVASSKQRGVKISLKVESLIKAGNIHQGLGRFQESNILYHKALKANMAFDSNPKLNYEAYLYLGSSMYFNGIIDSAKYYFEKTAEISVAYRNKIDLPEQDRLYNSLGAIYYESADYQQAKKYFETAIELASPRLTDYLSFKTFVSSNIANCLLKLRNYDASIQLLRGLRPNEDQKLLIQRNLAHAYFEKGEYDSAFSIYTKYKFPAGALKRLALNDLGRIYMEKGMFPEAKASFDSAILQSKNSGRNIKNKEDALSYLYLSELAQKKGQFVESIQWCNKALNEIHLNFKSLSPLDLPSDVSNTVSPITFFQILIYKAELLYKMYQKDKNYKDLIAALLTYERAFETENFISINFDNDDAKLFLVENSKSHYGSAIKIAYEAVRIDDNYLQQLIFFFESYKGNILRQNLEYTKLKQNAGIPDSLIEKENELKQLYAGYITKINLAVTEKESSQFQRKLSEIKLELSTLQKSYEKMQLFSWIGKSIDNNIPVKTLQNSLDGNTALLNYFLTKTDIYILVVTRHKIEVKKVPINGPYLEALNVYMQESLRIKEGHRYNGYNASNTLFNALMLPVYPAIKSVENIIIIPDDYLFFLPFDALVKTKGKRDFLIYDHSISYHYSVSLLMRKQESTIVENVSDSIIAFAPFANASSEARNNMNLLLPFSGKEISNPMTASFLNATATKENFLERYSQYNIIHLATHASLGNDSSSNWIQFFPDNDSVTSNRLYVHEIYNLQMRANDLVILSACESGAGLAAEGEGLLSLSRAFMYAGAEGIISTLYKTDDRVTAYLMGRFYHYTEKGYNPKDALRKSKIDLLLSSEMNSRFKAPNYWSNFVYIGKINPSKEGYNPLWIILIFVLPLGYLIYRYVIRRKQSNLN